MKTLIICFSQTGNTGKIAEYIQKGIVATGSQYSICDMGQPFLLSFAGQMRYLHHCRGGQEL